MSDEQDECKESVTRNTIPVEEEKKHQQYIDSLNNK